jgi:hypothetical protein
MPWKECSVRFTRPALSATAGLWLPGKIAKGRKHGRTISITVRPVIASDGWHPEQRSQRLLLPVPGLTRCNAKTLRARITARLGRVSPWRGQNP